MMRLVVQYRLLHDQILDLDRQVMACHRSSEASKRLATIPGVGPLAASALVASIGDASSLKNGRSFAAFIGLVPRQSSSGGKERLGKISKRGNHYLRWLLVVGSLAIIRYAQRHGTKRPWLIKLLQRRTTKIAAVAMANKIARIARVLMTRGWKGPKISHAVMVDHRRSAQPNNPRAPRARAFDRELISRIA